MAVKAYITRDQQGRPWPMTHQHEANGVIGLIQRLHRAVDHEQQLYAIFVNLQAPSADLVAVTELGLGVLELKHYGGSITQRGGLWYAGKQLIKAGVNAQTPRQQVQNYGERIRGRLIPHLARLWRVEKSRLEQELKLQTAVCFTNPWARIDRTGGEEIRQQADRDRRRWETFEVFTAPEFERWVCGLRFGAEQDRLAGFAAQRLTKAQIEGLAQSFFNATEWTEIRNLMPTGQPYGYLVVTREGQPVAALPLRQQEETLGRDGSKCSLPVADAYRRVSREHARVTRLAGEIWLEDLGSSHGTYVDGVWLEEPVLLQPGQRVLLGDEQPGDKVCELTLAYELPDALQSDATFFDPTVAS